LTEFNTTQAEFSHLYFKHCKNESEDFEMAWQQIQN